MERIQEILNKGLERYEKEHKIIGYNLYPDTIQKM